MKPGKKTARPVKPILFVLVMLLMGGIYLNLAWNRYQEIASSEAIMLVRSLESMTHYDHIEELTGSPEDLNNPEYQILKEDFRQVLDTNQNFRFAYLLKEKNGEIIFLLDGEPEESEDYSPPGQVYTEASETIWMALQEGIPLLTEPERDRWGTWITALAPVLSPETGKAIGVLGIDYPADEWYERIWQRMIPDIAIVTGLILLSLTLMLIWIQHNRLRVSNEKLAFNEQLYHSIFDQVPIGIALSADLNHVIRPDNQEISINHMYEKILGRSKEELMKVEWPDMTYAEDLKKDMEQFERFSRKEIPGYSMEKRFIRGDGSLVWTNMTVSPFLGTSGIEGLHLCLVEDITAQKEMEASYKEIEHRQAVLLSHLPGLAYRCNYDWNGTMTFVSEGCFELTGYPPESFIQNRDLPFNDIITPDYREMLWNEWQRTIPLHVPYKMEYEITTAQGQKKWVLEMGQGVYAADGQVEALEGIILDITDRKKFEDHLQYMNEHDPLTGLYNRDYLENLLTEDGNQNRDLERAVVGINLSTLQLLTAQYGFHYSQSVVKKVAEALEKCCHQDCQLFKTYEYRFVFYLKNYQGREGLEEFCREVIQVLEPILKAERVSGGIGALEIQGDDPTEADLLLKRLLIATEKSIDLFDRDLKICFYDQRFEEAILREEKIIGHLARIGEGEERESLFLCYQPIFDVPSDQICSFEALARLRLEEFGMIPPLEFIPLAEKTKLIIPVGWKIIRESLEFLQEAQARGDGKIKVSINISAIQLVQEDFSSRLLEMIHQMEVDPTQVILEITESVFSGDYEEINRILGELRKQGLFIAIDDFGTGYSSLARERELDVDCLKIDKYFIDKLMEPEPDKAITGDIISMAHKLGHCAIAEGVEKEAQKKYLVEQGCDMLQGYLIGKPMDLESALNLLEKERVKKVNG